jgi:hypothetical protein
MEILTGILILNTNKTFGRHNRKLLYKCIPYCKSDDPILIPYEIKLGFSKNIKNKFVTYQLRENGQGQLVEVYGDVDDLQAYYEYQITSRNLRFSMKKLFSHIDKPHIPKGGENRLNETVFTIDNFNTTDYDDAFSIIPMTDGGVKLSVYITNVAKVIEHFGLWDTLRENVVANIYLPDRKINILPPSLVEHYLSLKEGKERNTLCLDIIMDPEKNILDMRFGEALICVNKNFVYESAELLQSPHYLLLKHFSPTDKVKDSHDLVAHWMEYYSEHIPISETMREKVVYVYHYSIPSSTQNRFLYQMTRNLPKGYYTFDKSEKNLDGNNPYIHCTSPIRRIIDIYNQSVLLSLEFASLNIEFINEKIKQIRKLQIECALMNICFKKDNTIMNNTYSGLIFDIESTSNGKYRYMIYIEGLKLMTQMKSEIEYPVFSQQTFQLFLFQDENKIHKKIKVKIYTT